MQNLQPKPFSELSLVKQTFPDQKRLAGLTQLVLNRDAVSHADIEDSLRAISRRFERFPLKSRTIDLYTNNRIYLISNKETVQVPMSLPGWRVRTDRGVAAYVNAVPYVPAAGAGSMDVRRLFGLLVTGTVLVSSFEAWPKLHASLPLAKSCSAVYARMMHKVADRMTGVGMDRMRSDQIKYVFGKYAICGLLRRPVNETADAIATANTAGTASSALADFEVALAAAAGATNQSELYSLDFLAFLDALSKAAPWTNRLTVRGFLQTYTALLGAPALLAAEEIGYFLAMLAAHQAGAELVSSFSFDSIYGKEGDEAIDELARLLR